MILQNDPSMRPGWVTPYIDGSGWTGSDAVRSQENGWLLAIDSFGIAVIEGVRVPFLQGAFRAPPQEPNDLARLIERAMIGDELSIKALYLMVGNDPRYAEYADLVKALCR